ncbi:MAG: hypothetical protein LBB38_02310 [Puniceicoccales bacterium]|jgi:hypothetical protein|nr:hypothetical protein [Puniceicoccales bacterium]
MDKPLAYVAIVDRAIKLYPPLAEDQRTATVSRIFDICAIRTPEMFRSAAITALSYEIIQDTADDCSVLSWLIFLRHNNMQLYANMIVVLIGRGELVLQFPGGDPQRMPASFNFPIGDMRLGPPPIAILRTTILRHAGEITLRVQLLPAFEKIGLGELARKLSGERYTSTIGYHRLCDLDHEYSMECVFHCMATRSGDGLLEQLMDRWNLVLEFASDGDGKQLVVHYASLDNGPMADSIEIPAEFASIHSPLAALRKVFLKKSLFLIDKRVFIAIAIDAISMLMAGADQKVVDRLVPMQRIIADCHHTGCNELTVQRAHLMRRVMLFTPNARRIVVDNIYGGILFEECIVEHKPQLELLRRFGTITAIISFGETSSRPNVYIFMTTPVVIQFMMGRAMADEFTGKRDMAFSGSPEIPQCDAEFLANATPQLLCAALFRCGRRFNLAGGELVMLGISMEANDEMQTPAYGHSCCGVIVDSPYPNGTVTLIRTQTSAVRQSAIEISRLQLMLSEDECFSFLRFDKAFELLPPSERFAFVCAIASGSDERAQLTVVGSCNGNKFDAVPMSALSEYLTLKYGKVIFPLPGNCVIAVARPDITTPDIIELSS